MMSALAVMSVPAPRAWIRMLPEPLALTAVSSAAAVPGAVPLFRVIEPAVVRSTMLPSPPVVRMSLCTASVVVVSVVPSVPTRFTLRPTLSTVRASASNR